jgi:hypothetical protein
MHTSGAKSAEVRIDTMRVFTMACLFAAIVALSAATVLDNLVQESAKTAFAEPSARV